MKHRLAILLSGRGSNFEAIADAVESGTIPNTEIVAVISDVPDARGLALAKERGLPAFAVDRRAYRRGANTRTRCSRSWSGRSPSSSASRATCGSSRASS